MEPEGSVGRFLGMVLGGFWRSRGVMGGGLKSPPKPHFVIFSFTQLLDKEPSETMAVETYGNFDTQVEGWGADWGGWVL